MPQVGLVAQKLRDVHAYERMHAHHVLIHLSYSYYVFYVAQHCGVDVYVARDNRSHGTLHRRFSDSDSPPDLARLQAIDSDLSTCGESEARAQAMRSGDVSQAGRSPPRSRHSACVCHTPTSMRQSMDVTSPSSSAACDHCVWFRSDCKPRFRLSWLTGRSFDIALGTVSVIARRAIRILRR